MGAPRTAGAGGQARRTAGAPRRREIVNAIFYVVRGGNQWRAMPHDLPPWQTAFYYFRIWRNDGTWERDPHGAARADAPAPRAGGDAQRRHPGQSIGQDQAKGGPRGYDAHKQVKGRKRHLLVDTQGFVLKVVVSAADVQDRDGARLLAHARAALRARPCRACRLVWADAGYAGPLVDDLRQQMGWTLEVVKRATSNHAARFAVQPHRWIVERTFSWWGGLRRLAKDYEYQVESSEALIYAGMSHLMLRRLSRHNRRSQPDPVRLDNFQNGF